MESKPLIGSSVSTPVRNVTKKLKYSNWASILLYVVILGIACYFAYPLLLSNKKGKLSPARIATVTAENGYSAEATADLVTYLPNLEEEMTFNMFSGYLATNDDRELFYWFEESQSDTADMDPLVLWTYVVLFCLFVFFVCCLMLLFFFPFCHCFFFFTKHFCLFCFLQQWWSRLQWFSW